MKNLPELQRRAKAEIARRILAKRQFLSFIRYKSPWFRINWHHQLVADALERVERGELTRLMIFLPPRHSKSEMVSVSFPPWVLGRDKNKSIIATSYSDGLASGFGRQARNIVDSPEYQRIFDTKLAEDSKSKSQWNTNGRGTYNAVGVGGSVTGKGADILIIDDPIKNRQDAESATIRESIFDWYRSTARTRLSPTGAIILCLTRWHDDDLAGRLLEEDPEGWEVISLPAIAEEDEQYRSEGEALWPDQFNLENLKQTKKDVGLYEWSALYQQNPISSETQEFSKSFFKSVAKRQVDELITSCFITIDPAVKEKDTADYTGTVINWVDTDSNWHIKAERSRMNSAKLIEHIFDLWKTYKPDGIGIEETTFMSAIYPFLELEMKRRNVFPIIYPLKHGGREKNLRIRGLIPRYEAGTIFHIDGECKPLEEEELRFPKGKHDDVVDALAYMDQIVVPPMVPPGYIEQARSNMQVDERTGYLH